MPTTVTGARPLPTAVVRHVATRLTPDVRAAAPTLRGHVRSVHRAAIYIDLDPPRTSGTLLVIAIDDVGGVPGGILVGDTADLRLGGIRPGMATAGSARGVAIPAAGIEIDFTTAVDWSPALPAAAQLRPSSELGRTVAAARSLAAVYARHGGLDLVTRADDRGADPWRVRAASLIERQLDALASGDADAAADATIELIGLGVGLTPSGDDYLVGLLAGLQATGDPGRGGLAAVITDRAAVRTTAIGAATLHNAAAGAFAERLHDVLVALGRGRLHDLARAIERATAYGSTSGGDTLVGLFSALDHAVASSSDVPRAAA